MRIEKKVVQPDPITTIVMEMDPEDMIAILLMLRMVAPDRMTSWDRHRYHNIVGEMTIMEADLSSGEEDAYDPSIGG